VADVMAPVKLRLDGSSWSTLGSGLNSPPSALTVFNGKTDAGGVLQSRCRQRNYIAVLGWLRLVITRGGSEFICICSERV